MIATERRPRLLPLVAAVVLLSLVVVSPAGWADDEEDLEGAEPTLTVAVDVHDELSASSWSTQGRVASLVHGADRGGETATSDEVDAEAAAQAERSLEELGAERTPDGLVVTLPETILFEFDSADLVGDADDTIDDVAELLDYYADVEVEVQGHTDDHGEADYNQNLSEARAEAVYDALVAAGASSSQLTPVGFGQTEPVAPNETDDGEDDPEGRERNRRVEIVLRDE